LTPTSFTLLSKIPDADFELIRQQHKVRGLPAQLQSEDWRLQAPSWWARSTAMEILAKRQVINTAAIAASSRRQLSGRR